MNEFRRLAAKIDQHMQQLAAQGVSEAHAIINRMMGYGPDLHRIWVGTSDQQLMALSREFPGFYRYARIMEEASEAERRKASRPYDGMAEFSEQHKQMGAQLLTTAATLERGYPGVSCERQSPRLPASARRAGPPASAMAVRPGSLQRLAAHAGRRTQGAGIRERGFRPPGRAHQAACRLIAGIFGGSGFVAPCTRVLSNSDSRGASCIELLTVPGQKFYAHTAASPVNWCSRLLKTTHGI